MSNSILGRLKDQLEQAQQSLATEQAKPVEQQNAKRIQQFQDLCQTLQAKIDQLSV